MKFYDKIGDRDGGCINMEKLLVLGDGLEMINKLDGLGIKAQYLDLRRNHETAEIMDIYEVVAPELCAVVRDEISAIAPDRIVVIGASEEYRWDATIVCRLFGQFNSWLNQRQNKFGKTVLNIAGKEVELIAIDDLSDWDLAHEG